MLLKTNKKYILSYAVLIATDTDIHWACGCVCVYSCQIRATVLLI